MSRYEYGRDMLVMLDTIKALELFTLMQFEGGKICFKMGDWGYTYFRKFVTAKY